MLPTGKGAAPAENGSNYFRDGKRLHIRENHLSLLNRNAPTQYRKYMGADGFAFSETKARLERAANGLAQNTPHLSARGGMTRSQKVSGVLILTGMVAVISVAPEAAYWASFCVFAALILWRAFLVSVAITDSAPPLPLRLNDEDLPPYSVLIALYDEARSVPGLIAALKAFNYPADRLDIHLLLEQADTATYAALLKIGLPDHVCVHRLAPGTPQTKPRALNYGLEYCAGEYVTIYDAEDLPHPDQLRRSAEMFASAPPRLACVQAPLTAHNARESWISAQWGLEYEIQFGLLVPALARTGCPIPLGGTSNHFRRDALEKAGGWDAWNVTEDADLGLRFARMGKQIGVISPPTLEEAPETLNVWLAQRSRWIKGFIQSWLVLMRSPGRCVEDMGLARWLAMQLTLGGAILSAMLAGPMAVWLALCCFLPGLELGIAGAALLLSGLGVNVIAALAAARQITPGWIRTVATLPLYWPLLSLATLRALYGLARTPHFWAKTPHGLTAAQIDESISFAHPRLDPDAHRPDGICRTRGLRQLESKSTLG